MRKILCPTDFSEPSLEAYNFASQVALALSADLVLYHASSLPLGTSDKVYFRDPKDFPEELKMENRRILETWQRLKNSEAVVGKHIHYDFITEQGFPLVSIMKAVVKYDADLIIIHTRARKKERIEGALLGNIGFGIIEEASCGVMLVPSGVSHEFIKNIVYSIDLEDYGDESVRKVIEYAQKLNAQVKFVYFTSGDASALVEKFESTIPEFIRSGMASTVVKDGRDIYYELNTFLHELPADMLVMERHQKRILRELLSKSLIRVMARHSEIPMLIMHVID